MFSRADLIFLHAPERVRFSQAFHPLRSRQRSGALHPGLRDVPHRLHDDGRVPGTPWSAACASSTWPCACSTMRTSIPKRSITRAQPGGLRHRPALAAPRPRRAGGGRDGQTPSSRHTDHLRRLLGDLLPRGVDPLPVRGLCDPRRFGRGAAAPAHGAPDGQRKARRGWPTSPT